MGSNWSIASRLAGQDARNLSKRGGGGDALPFLPPTENELHVKAERKMRSKIRSVDGGVRIAVIVIVPIIVGLWL